MTSKRTYLRDVAVCGALAMAFIGLGTERAEAANGCPQAATNPLRSFRIFDATLYQNKPDLSALGIEAITVHYGEMWKGPAHNQEVPEEKTLEDLALKHSPGKGLVVLDVEQWPLKGTDEQIEDSLSKLRLLVSRFRSKAPEKSFGFYGIVPLADYWRAIKGPGSQEYHAWQKENDRIASVERSVDALFPSIYTFYEDQAGWRKFAEAQICEARRMSRKPVYAFIWPEFHDSTKLKGTFLRPEYWRMELETLRTIADGVVIWGGYDTQLRRPRQWDDGAAWWLQTQEFVKTLRR